MRILICGQTVTSPIGFRRAIVKLSVGDPAFAILTASNSEPNETWGLKNNTTRGYKARLTWSPGKYLWYPSCLFVLRQRIVSVTPQIDTPEISHFRPNCIHDRVKTWK